MMSKGKAQYGRGSNQSYQPMQPGQAPMQNYQRPHQHYPQAMMMNPVRNQPNGMQYATQPVNIMPQTIVQTVPSQNTMRPFIPMQNAFVQNVPNPTYDQANQFSGGSQYLYVGPGTPIAQPIHAYQPPTSQPLQQAIPGQYMLQQPPQQNQGAAVPASSQQQPQQPHQQQAQHNSMQPPQHQHQQKQQQIPVRQEKKKSSAIRITDPRQGGKDVTDQILKKKKESSSNSPGVGIENEKIKAEFAAKVAAKVSTKENYNNGVEDYGFIPQEQVEPSNDLHNQAYLDNNPVKDVETASDISNSMHLQTEESEVGKITNDKAKQDDISVSKEVPVSNDVSISPDNAKSESSGNEDKVDSKIKDETCEEVQQKVESPNASPPVLSNDNEHASIAKPIAEETGLVNQESNKDALHAKESAQVEETKKEVIDSHVEDKSLADGRAESVIAESPKPVEEQKGGDTCQGKLPEEVTAPAVATTPAVEPATPTEPISHVEPTHHVEAEPSVHSPADPPPVELSPTVETTPTVKPTPPVKVDPTPPVIKDADTTSTIEPVVNGVETSHAEPAAAQAVSKKKKTSLKQRMKEISSKGAKDADLMSAFIDKQEVEVPSPEPQTEEVLPEAEAPVVDETWESKEIEDATKSDKRITYDRDFLLGFQLNSIEKPKDLPNLELVLPEAHPPTKPIDKNSRMQQSGHNDFMPQYMRQASGGRQVGPGRSGKGNRAPPPKKIIPTTFETKIELKKSDNAWVRPSEKPVEGEDQELFRKARGILNKLTPEKFNRLVEQMKALEINTTEKLRGVIDIIFEKAISEPGFSAAYAKLCFEISQWKLNLDGGKNVTFKRLLLNKCQHEFEKEKSDEQELEKDQNKHFENAEEEKNWQEELLQKKYKAKKRTLGNIRFIGELFKLKMLTEAIMHTCVVKLLKDGDEESLECLCQLLTTIGKDLDHERAKQRTDQYFDQINKVVQQRKVSSRIVFMLQNIQELRATNWVSRRVTDAPKTIGEIHKEAKQEEMQMQMAHLQQAAQKRSSGKGGRESPAMMRGSGAPEEGGWNQVPVSGKSNRSIQQVDSSKLKTFTRRQESENISLGPGNRPGIWAQGASGGGGSSRFGPIANNDEPRQGNRFEALSGGDSSSHRSDKGRPGSRGGPPSGRFGRVGAGAPTSRRGPQQQRVADDRAAALESVRRIVIDQPKTPSPTNIAPKVLEDEKPLEESAKVPEVPEVPTETGNSAGKLSESKVQKETKLTIEEFMLNHDLKEAENCIRELNAGPLSHFIVSEAVNIAIEKKMEQVEEVGSLLHSFTKSNLITIEHFKKGLSEVFELAEDMAMDIPHIWTNLGIMLGPVVEDSSVSLSDLKALMEPNIRPNQAALLMSQVLSAAAKISTNKAVANLWQKSGLKWETMLGQDNDVASFLEKHKMEFTIAADQEDPWGHLVEMLKTSCTCDSVIQFIEKQFSDRSSVEFLRNLCKAIFTLGIQNDGSNVKLDVKFIKEYKTVLLKCIGDKSNELQVLFAAQNLAEDLKHPREFLRALLETLYDEEIISEESVNAWEKSEEEQQGKGVALESVKGFLEWLKNVEDK